MKKIYIILLSILFLLLQFSCKDTNNQNATPAPSFIKAPTVPGAKGIVLASIPFENELKLIEGWQTLADYLSASTGVPVTLDIKKSYKEIIEGLSSGDIDMANTGALVYVKANNDSGAYPIVKPVTLTDGQTYYKSYIIVRKDSGIKKISQLKGKRFAFTDRDSTSGYLMPISMLFYGGVKNLSFFSKYIFTGDHDSAFLAVYNGYVEAAGISNFAFIKGIDKRLVDVVVIKESEPIPTGPIVVKKGMDKELVQKLKKALLSVGKTEKTKNILEMMKIDGYTEASDKDYVSIRKAQKALTKMGLTE